MLRYWISISYYTGSQFSTAGYFYESDVYKDDKKYTAVLNDYLCNKLFIIRQNISRKE